MDMTTDTDTHDRALATITTIRAIEPIDGADEIEAVTVRNWRVAVRKSDHAKVGDRCVYVEVDTLVPVDDPRFAFLAAGGVRTMTDLDGTTHTGHVLKTAKRRGLWSQGLVVLADQFPEFAGLPAETDVTSLLGMRKFEKDVPEEIRAAAVGAIPTRFAPVTKATRAQNLGGVWDMLARDGSWIATEKVDGESTTIINDAGTLRVCGRQWEYRSGHTRIWELAERYRLAERLPDGWALQAEMYGEGAPSNPLKVKGLHLAVFGLLAGGKPIGRDSWPDWAFEFASPVHDFTFPANPDEALAQVDQLMSKINPQRAAEGIVWTERTGRCFDVLDGRATIKVIGPRYLLKNDR